MNLDRRTINHLSLKTIDSFDEVEQYNKGMRIDDVPPMLIALMADTEDPTEHISRRQLDKLENVNSDTDVCYKCGSPDITVRNMKSKSKGQHNEDLKPVCDNCFCAKFEREHADYINENPADRRIAMELLGFTPGLPSINMPPPTGDLLIHTSFGTKLENTYSQHSDDPPWFEDDYDLDAAMLKSLETEDPELLDLIKSHDLEKNHA